MTRPKTLGARIFDWTVRTFGAECATGPERAIRLLEEAVELAQSECVPRIAAERVIARVFDRPGGNPRKEASQVALTLGAYCEWKGWDPVDLASEEADRVESIPIEQWRTRHEAKQGDGIVQSLTTSKGAEMGKIELGSKVRDRITGFEGVVTGRAQYLHGVDNALVEALTGNDGEQHSEWIAETRLELVS
jgi:hypothetical protein